MEFARRRTRQLAELLALKVAGLWTGLLLVLCGSVDRVNLAYARQCRYLRSGANSFGHRIPPYRLASSPEQGLIHHSVTSPTGEALPIQSGGQLKTPFIASAVVSPARHLLARGCGVFYIAEADLKRTWSAELFVMRCHIHQRDRIRFGRSTKARTSKTLHNSLPLLNSGRIFFLAVAQLVGVSR